MQLLVSVAGAADASEALAGGADWIDAKDPSAGPLGPVALPVLTDIRATVAGARPLTAALGDIDDAAAAERAAEQYSRLGVALVKIGTGLAPDEQALARLVAAAVRGAQTGGEGLSGVVAVAYADAGPWGRNPETFVEVAARAGAGGVLIDTAQKEGPGLRALLSESLLASWVASARAAGVLAAMAGRLTVEDVAELAGCDPDIVGVRGAACPDGRTGAVASARVIALRTACAPPGRPARRPPSAADAVHAQSTDRPAGLPLRTV